MEIITTTVTIHNVPKKQFDFIFTEGLKRLGVGVEAKKDIILDFDTMPIDVFAQIMATAMAAYCADEKMKDKMKI